MEEAIREALDLLDTENDDHWTSQGLPKVDVIREIAEDPSITRSQIESACPGFCRSVESQTVDMQAEAPAVDSIEDNTGTVEVGDELEAEQKTLAEMQAAAEKLRLAIDKQMGRVDELILEKQKSDSRRNQAEEYQRHIQVQIEVRRQKLERQKLIDEALGLANLCPLERALRQRRIPSRPEFPAMGGLK